MSQPAGSRRQTIEQKRAQFALSRVREVSSNQRRIAGRYRQEVMGLPSMVLTNGLGQTLAFLKAKGAGSQNEHATAYRHLNDWVRAQLSLGDDLLEAVTQMDVSVYRLAQSEALAVLGWLKRFAEAELPKEGSA